MKIKHTILALGVTALIASCATNPFTGKKTMALVPNSQLFPTAFSQYDQFLTSNKVLTGTSDAQMIKRVGQRIAVAAERWLNANGHEGYLNDYKWEYNLVDDKNVNAWCMPGGKIVFYTGILPIANGETGVAAIMGHEVAHALAPFSRNHETEADRIGLYLMAIAGYNPTEAAELWKRMKANSGGEAPPEMLSTHPSNDSRIANLTALAPKAVAEARKFGVTSFR